MNVARAARAYALVFSLYIIWSSAVTLMKASSDAQVALIATVEVIAAILFCLRRTRTTGLALLLGAFLVATIVEIKSAPMSFVFYGASAVLAWHITRGKTGAEIA